ncbi:hypothetical protein [Cohnella sp. 56]|uniref:hypothetical protein n=1 Tax=Cohnella sp. 56 TaxID=3113722 RepID=UPI0030E8D090
MSKRASANESGVLLTSSCRTPRRKKHHPKPCRCKPHRKHKKPDGGHRSHHLSHHRSHHYSGGIAPAVPEQIVPGAEELGGLGGLGGIGTLGGLEGGLGWGPGPGLDGLGVLGGPGGIDPGPGGGHHSHEPHRSRRTSGGTATTYSRKKR